MSLRFLLTLAVGLAFALPAAAQPKANPAKAKPATADTVVEALHQPFDLPDVFNINDTPLLELLTLVSMKADLAVVIMEGQFRVEGVNEIKERKPTVGIVGVKSITAHKLLSLVLDDMQATYLVKNGRIEIVPIKHAARVAKAAVTQDEAGQTLLVEPLVSVVVKEKPLNEVVAELAERYDLNAVVSPQAADARSGFITARLLNVPADKALDLLALQCDLRVVRKGNTFMLTSRDHANELFAERFERERQKIELEKLREMPPPKPEPAPMPVPVPEPKVEPKP